MIDLEAFPEELKAGEPWIALDLDPDWVWVAHDERGAIVGLLIAAPCHGMVFLWRIKMLPTAPHFALGRLFRAFIRDLRKRGCVGYMALLDVVSSPTEQQLAKIAFRAGAMFTTASTVVYGSVAAKHVGER